MGYRNRYAKSRPAIPRCLIVVRRDDPELCEYLHTLAGGVDVQILLDRRRNHEVLGAERYEADRRQPLSTEKDLRLRQYIIVSPRRSLFGA